MDPTKDNGAEQYSATGSGVATRGRHHLHSAPPEPKEPLPDQGNLEHEEDARHPGDTVADSDGTPPTRPSKH